MSEFLKELDKLKNKGVDLDTLTMGEVFPYWEESDERLQSVSQEYQGMTPFDLVEIFGKTPSPGLQKLLEVSVEFLNFWKEYETLRSEIDISDPVELLKFDVEFRRYVYRKNQQNSSPETNSQTYSNSNTFSRAEEVFLDKNIFEPDSLESEEEPQESQEPQRSLGTFEEFTFPEDNFSLVEFLGKGAEAKVYLAKDDITGDLVALKQYEVFQQSAEQTLEKLGQQVKLLTQLCHPNVVKCLGMHIPRPSTSNMAVFNLVFEYLEQGSLADLLQKKSSLSLSEVKEIAADVLEGLNYLHSVNIIHRDLKPSNIMIGDLCKITDLGICKQVLELQTEPRSCVGTLWYMAPEVIDQEPYSFAADIWSVGSLLFELYTGQKPFGGESFKSLIHHIANYSTPLDVYNKEVPQDFANFLQKCWRRPHSLRPSAKELLQHSFLIKR